MEGHTITEDQDRIKNMNTKKITILLIAGIVVLGLISAVILLSGKDNKTVVGTDGTPTPTKEVEFVVVRVLPSGFSPKEVSIKKGMIVRFTNPTDTKVLLKWEGEKQYTNEAVFEGNDIATTVFDTEGEYAFSKESNPSHVGKVVVK